MKQYIHKDIIETINRTSLVERTSSLQDTLYYTTKNSERDTLFIHKEDNQILYLLKVKDNNMRYDDNPITYGQYANFNGLNVILDKKLMELVFISNVNDNNVLLKSYYNVNNSPYNFKEDYTLQYVFSQIYPNSTNNLISDILDTERDIIINREEEIQIETIIRDNIISIIKNIIGENNAILIVRPMINKDNNIEIKFIFTIHNEKINGSDELISKIKNNKNNIIQLSYDYLNKNYSDMTFNIDFTITISDLDKKLITNLLCDIDLV